MVELLAPAGNFESLRAAVNAGADAVYLAGNLFGARAFAKNFDEQNLSDAIRFAHLHRVAIHVTVNTILIDDEFESLEKYLRFLYNTGADAILVQDLGVADFARKVVPKLPLHASTQMTIHSLAGVRALESLNFSRVVLARELTIEEIQNICDNSNVEIEIFSHGAICVCYSGQCLMSSLIGGRSGNRGKCAQPCRLPYQLVDSHGKNLLSNAAGNYLLSPRDFNTLKILPKLVKTGISSLKIEGRMKRPEYVATVVEIYRRALDSASEVDDSKKLEQVFNRGFTTAYLETTNQTRSPVKNFISDKRPNHRGLAVGRVISYDQKKVRIKLTEKVSAGDQLEFWVKIGGRVTATLEKFSLRDNVLTFELDKKVQSGDRVFKIFDSELNAHAEKIIAAERKIPLEVFVKSAVGEKILVRAVDDEKNSVEIFSESAMESAEKRPATLEFVRKQFDRLGTTSFEISKLDAELDGQVLIPASVLNNLRREVVEKIESLRLKKYDRDKNISERVPKIIPRQLPNEVEIVAQVDSIESERIAINAGADSILFGGESFQHKNLSLKNYSDAMELAKSQGRKIYLETPRIIRMNEEKFFTELFEFEPECFYVHNIAFADLLRIRGKKFRTNFSMLTANLKTLEFLKNFGAIGATLSPELSLDQIRFLADNSPIELDLIVHGRAELMISSYCPLGTFLNSNEPCSMPCLQSRYFLRDRMNIDFPIVTDQFCRLHILNSKVLSMLDHVNEMNNLHIERLRIDARNVDEKNLTTAIRAYKTNKKIEVDSSEITHGHFFRGAY